MKLQDAEEYRTGLDLPDLTDAANMALFRKWDGVDATYLRILHFIRICGEFPDVVHIARIGRDKPPVGDLLKRSDDTMEIDEIGLKAGAIGIVVG